MGLLAKLSRGICLYEATAGRLTGAKRRRRNAIACFYKRINENDIKIYHLRNGWLLDTHANNPNLPRSCFARAPAWRSKDQNRFFGSARSVPVFFYFSNKTARLKERFCLGGSQASGGANLLIHSESHMSFGTSLGPPFLPDDTEWSSFSFCPMTKTSA